MTLPILRYLKLQPVESDDDGDGSLSELDSYAQDEEIDLTQDEDGEQLEQTWREIATADSLEALDNKNDCHD